MGLKAQIILILGVSMLLSHVNRNVNETILTSKDFSYENEAIIVATSIGKSFIREASMLRFDEFTTTRKTLLADSLTLANALGAESGEVYGSYDDVDDYNGLIRSVPTDRMGNFAVRVNVWYTTTALRGALSSNRSFLKTVETTVYGNRYLRDSLKIRSIVSY